MYVINVVVVVVVGILHESQYSFREKRSTEHAILEIINQIQTTWIVGCTPAEYSLIYKRLLTQHYGVRGIVNDWFTSYLTARKQITDIGP